MPGCTPAPCPRASSSASGPTTQVGWAAARRSAFRVLQAWFAAGVSVPCPPDSQTVHTPKDLTPFTCADVWVRHAAAQANASERFLELPHALRQEVAWEANRRLLGRLSLFRRAGGRGDACAGNPASCCGRCGLAECGVGRLAVGQHACAHTSCARRWCANIAPSCRAIAAGSWMRSSALRCPLHWFHLTSRQVAHNPGGCEIKDNQSSSSCTLMETWVRHGQQGRLGLFLPSSQPPLRRATLVNHSCCRPGAVPARRPRRPAVPAA